MMHGHEKSDSAIVAGKPTNKAVPTAAEPVEPKGNASQQSTHRTQGRERVSRALERLRQAAQRKKEKFTALLHHISIDSLRMAFFALKRDAASGVDGLTWPTYEADLERNLTHLHERVHRGAYRALLLTAAANAFIICQAAIFEMASKAATTPVAPAVSRVFAFLMQEEQSIAVDQKSPGGRDSPQGLILFDGVCVLWR
jgi:hypothetical protein